MKYVEINVRGYNKMYTVSNVEVEQKINAFANEDKSSVHYLPVRTNRGETLKLQWDSKRTIKILPDYLESEVSGEIVEVGERYIGKVCHNRLSRYL